MLFRFRIIWLVGFALQWLVLMTLSSTYSDSTRKTTAACACRPTTPHFVVNSVMCDEFWICIWRNFACSSELWFVILKIDKNHDAPQTICFVGSASVPNNATRSSTSLIEPVAAVAPHTMWNFEAYCEKTEFFNNHRSKVFGIFSRVYVLKIEYRIAV